jgi:hypothetical protein
VSAQPIILVGLRGYAGSNDNGYMRVASGIPAPDKPGKMPLTSRGRLLFSCSLPAILCLLSSPEERRFKEFGTLPDSSPRLKEVLELSYFLIQKHRLVHLTQVSRQSRLVCASNKSFNHAHDIAALLSWLNG